MDFVLIHVQTPWEVTNKLSSSVKLTSFHIFDHLPQGTRQKLLVVVFTLSTESNISSYREIFWSNPQPILQNILFSFTEMLSCNLTLTFEITCTDLILRTSGPLPPGASERGTTKAREKKIWGRKWDCLFPIFFTCQLPTTDPIPETGYFSCTGCASVFPGTSQCKYDYHNRQLTNIYGLCANTKTTRGYQWIKSGAYHLD